MSRESVSSLNLSSLLADPLLTCQESDEKVLFLHPCDHPLDFLQCGWIISSTMSGSQLQVACLWGSFPCTTLSRDHIRIIMNSAYQHTQQWSPKLVQPLHFVLSGDVCSMTLLHQCGSASCGLMIDSGPHCVYLLTALLSCFQWESGITFCSPV